MGLTEARGFNDTTQVIKEGETLRKNTSIYLVSLFAASAFIMGGCISVGPDYKEPELNVPEGWGGSTNGVSPGVSSISEWWSVFNDETLNGLIEKAATNSPDLKIAAERIEEAAALNGVAKSYWYPQIAAEGNITSLRASEAVYSTLPPGKNKATYYSIGGSMGWELDLWGHVRRLVESSRASMQATIEAYRDTMVILYGEIAYQYIQVRTLQNRIELTRQSIRLQEETLQMTSDRNKAGLSPDLDLYQAKMNLAQSRAAIPPLRIALAKATHRLAVLVGDEPASLRELMQVDKSKIPVPPEEIAVAVPADVMRQRPDVRAAERRLAAQTALIGVKKAELYPTLTLPGTLRIEAYSAGDLDGDALSYGFGPGLRWNLFSGGRIRAEIKAEESRSRQAYIGYKQTILRALEDVENSMVSIREERLRVESLRDAVTASGKSLDLVKDLYKAGLTDFQNVLATEQAYMHNRDKLSAAEGNIAAYTVQLYKALGGGWHAEEPDALDDKSGVKENGEVQKVADEPTESDKKQ